MTWALKRQLYYICVLVVFIAGLAALISYPYLKKAPTCFDLKQNGDETGVDCGGSCARACVAPLSEISVLWSRAFKVVPGRYNAVAYLQNKNENVAAQKINYRFRFADKDNIYIGKREGSTLVPPAGKFAVFEPAIDIGNSVPVYTTFEFTSTPVWLQVDEDKISQLKIFAKNVVLEDVETTPRMSAVIENPSLFNVPGINVVAILYDKSGNASAVSKTYLEELRAEEEKQIYFTWPEPITAEVVFKEIIPIYDIFSAKLK
jgi:hypothetical protein